MYVYRTQWLSCVNAVVGVQGQALEPRCSSGWRAAAAAPAESRVGAMTAALSCWYSSDPALGWFLSLTSKQSTADKDALLPRMPAAGSAQPLGKLLRRESGQLLFAAIAHSVCLGKVIPPLQGEGPGGEETVFIYQLSPELS